MDDLIRGSVILKEPEPYKYIGDFNMKIKNKKTKPIYKIHNPNTQEKTLETLTETIITIMLKDKKK